jgi:ABC-2 type transport system permease protein
MTTVAAPGSGLLELRPARRAAMTAFLALLLRDLTVLRKNFIAFALRTVLQPVLLVFVFTYVFPKIGQGIGGGGATAAAFSTLLVPGVVATSVIFQGIQAVALPLVQEFGYTREIDDRVMAPLPVWAVAAGKIASGMVQGMVAAAIVFPLAAIIPATPVHLSVNWQLIPVLLLATALGASLGLTIGTRAAPQQVPLVFGIIVIPITFLGATYYPWVRLTPIPWLKAFVLFNPLVYMSEGFRTALTVGIPHMPIVAIYGALIGFTGLLGYLGIAGFRNRVLT